LLLSHYWEDPANSSAGMKAFYTNRVADIALLIGTFVLGTAMGSFNIESINAAAAEGSPEITGVAFAGAILLFIGAMGKSAQFPFHVWLPDAMAGPTPVSALMHAATMVTAGVYLVARMFPLFQSLAGQHRNWVFIVGSITMLLGLLALVQKDIKRVLAYSTVSQLGYMFLAAGCGGYAAAMFHLATHAFFKALLFLGAGAVILATHHEQDIEKMGGLRRKIPRTHAVFLVGVLAIAGFPPLSGFFSKDEILLSVYAGHVPGHRWLWALGLATAAITSFYMFRLHFKTFYGTSRMPPEPSAHVHEPGPTVLGPLYVLAVLSAVAGFAGLPQVYGDMLGVTDSNSLANFLAPAIGLAEHALEQSTELALAGFAVAAGLLGLALAFVMYLQNPELPVRLARALAGPYQLLRNKYYVDELYDALIVGPLVRLSDAVLYRTIDAGLIDGLAVNGVARAVRAAAADSLKYLQSGLAQSYLILMMLGTAAVVGWLLLA
jgi:NADH-quinone oxidoreductase subunit L